MNQGFLLPVLVGVLGLVVLGYVVLVVALRRRLAAAAGRVDAAWREVEVALIDRHRHAEALSRATDAHESLTPHVREVIDRAVVGASHAGTPVGRARREDELTHALDAVAAEAQAGGAAGSEAYRDARRALARADDDVAAARRYYNSLVPAHNALCRGVVGRVVARRLDRAPVQYFLPGDALPATADLAGPDARYRPPLDV